MHIPLKKPEIHITPAVVRRTVREYIVISLALMLYAFSWMGILRPATVTSGGATGVAMMLYYSTGLPVGLTLFAINGALILVASFMIGFRFSAKTIYAIAFLSVAMGMMQTIPNDLIGMAGDRLLSSILGGALGGVSLGIVFLQGGSTGGTDIIAMIINKFRAISYGRIMMTCDVLIIGSSYFIESGESGIATVIYSFIVVGVSGLTVDYVLAGNKQSSQILIISEAYEQIAERVVHEMGRGVTILDGHGWYTKKEHPVVMVVCRKNETGRLLRIVKECDTQAFLSVSSALGVYGLGFDALRK
jgi:uncharacterized membrane-anchored protein YitT (DUF2179 family)